MSERLINITHSTERNSGSPLECQLCRMELVKPVRLPCQHYFCYACLGTMQCPLCGIVVEGQLMEDSVLSYVIESSHERTEICANCDKITQPMYFCETCQQPLCGHCRELTHKAKIFATHHIALLEERGRLRSRLVCDIHNEPFIIFCQDLRKLMCIECFNASSSMRKGNFLNVDLAHKVCCDKLDKAVAQLRLFQEDVFEQIELRRRFVTELENNFNTNLQNLDSNFEAVFALITRLKIALVAQLENEKIRKQKFVEEQLRNLENLQGPVRLNLLSASIFCSYASKIDLLHHFSELSKAIQHVMLNKTDKLLLSSEFFMSFKDELVKELSKNFFDFNLMRSSYEHENMETSMDSAQNSNSRSILIEGDPHSFHLVAEMAEKPRVELVVGDFLQKFSDDLLVDFSGSTANSINLLSDSNTKYVERMQQIDAPMSGYFSEIASLSKALVDVQRDITLRRCLVSSENFLHLLGACEKLKNDVSEHKSFASGLQSLFREVWNKQVKQIQQQQVLYRKKIEELTYLCGFSSKIFDSAQQLRPFAFYISSIISALDVKRSQAENFSPMEQICMQISSLEPDSRQRIDAIEREEESRRMVKMQEKLLEVPEAQRVKNNLKETRISTIGKATHQAVVFVEERDRLSSTIMTAKSLKMKKKVRRDGKNSSDTCTSSSIFTMNDSDDLTSALNNANELEIRCASSLASTPSLLSHSSISPSISQSSALCSSLSDNLSDTKLDVELLYVPDKSKHDISPRVVIKTANDVNNCLGCGIFDQASCAVFEPLELKAEKKRKSQVLIPESRPTDFKSSIKDETIMKPLGRLGRMSPQLRTLANLIESQLKGVEKETGKKFEEDNAQTSTMINAENDYKTKLNDSDAVQIKETFPSKATRCADDTVNVEKSSSLAQNLPKFLLQTPSVLAASEATFQARNRLLQSIKEHVKRID